MNYERNIHVYFVYLEPNVIPQTGYMPESLLNDNGFFMFLNF